MAFQSTVRQFPTDGIVGDFALDGPIRSKSIILKSSDATQNVIGRAVTYVAAQDDQAIAGGTGAFAGILTNSKLYASLGTTAGGPLAATLTLPNDLPVQATTLATGIYVTLSTTANIGDGVAYHNTTGVLAAAPANVPPATHTLIVGSSVIRRNITAPGLAIIELLNS